MKMLILPKNLTIKVSAIELDSDDIFEDEEELSEIMSDYISELFGYCHYGFEMERIYNQENEPSKIIIKNIKWDKSEG